MAHGVMHTTSMGVLHKTQFGGPYLNLRLLLPQMHTWHDYNGTKARNWEIKRKEKERVVHVTIMPHSIFVLAQSTKIDTITPNPYMEKHLQMHRCKPPCAN